MMETGLNTFEIELQRAFADFVDAEIAPAAIRAANDPVDSAEWLQRIGKLGYLGFANGDAGELGLSAEAIVVGEIARVWGALAVSVAQVLLGARALALAGSNPEALASVCDGTKSIAVARTQEIADRSESLLVVGPPSSAMALILPGDDTVSPAAISMGRVEWPDDAEGFEGLAGLNAANVAVAPSPLDAGLTARLVASDRILLAAAAAGLAQGALDHGLSYTLQRTQFGRPIAAFGEIQALMVHASTRTRMAQNMVRIGVQQFDSNEFSVPNATHIFIGSTDAAIRVVERVQHAFGGYGHMREYPIGRYVRDVRTLASLAGSHARLIRVLGAHLGLPNRLPAVVVGA